MFLFTDIEGSTRLWEEGPDEMRLALERHDRILRDAISAHDGYVFSTAGDAFSAAFGRAVDAVEASLDAQAQLAAETWAPRARVRVRMGLHTGEAQERDGDYFGRTLNRCARLMSAASGGQVLLSDVTAGLVQRDGMVDLGTHQLSSEATRPADRADRPSRCHREPSRRWRSWRETMSRADPATGGAQMSEETSVVVVEDDPNIADLVDLYLRQAGYRVLQASDGERGLELIESRRPDLAILDIGLPGDLDGLDLCRELRARGDLPIIMLTARDDELDRVLGLELGADDYVTKPFSPRELVSRVKAILRRAAAPPPAPAAVVTVGDIEVDAGRREARSNGAPISLAAREFDLLAYLAHNQGLALSRRQLLDGVWGVDWVGDERTVDVHVRQLRKKLGDGLPLDTVWGVGYRLN